MGWGDWRFGVGVKCESLGQILFAKPKHFPKLKIKKDLEIKIHWRTKTVVEIIQNVRDKKSQKSQEEYLKKRSRTQGLARLHKDTFSGSQNVKSGSLKPRMFCKTFGELKNNPKEHYLKGIIKKKFLKVKQQIIFHANIMVNIILCFHLMDCYLAKAKFLPQLGSYRWTIFWKFKSNLCLISKNFNIVFKIIRKWSFSFFVFRNYINNVTYFTFLLSMLSENDSSGFKVCSLWLTTKKLSNSGKQICNREKSSLNWAQGS